MKHTPTLWAAIILKKVKQPNFFYISFFVSVFVMMSNTLASNRITFHWHLPRNKCNKSFQIWHGAVSCSRLTCAGATEAGKSLPAVNVSKVITWITERNWPWSLKSESNFYSLHWISNLTEFKQQQQKRSLSLNYTSTKASYLTWQ